MKLTDPQRAVIEELAVLPLNSAVIINYRTGFVHFRRDSTSYGSPLGYTSADLYKAAHALITLGVLHLLRISADDETEYALTPDALASNWFRALKFAKEIS